MVADRIGVGPISWGVCEVPGWGVMLDADRVLAEMASLGIGALELGAPGFLPRDPAALRTVLDRHGARLIGGFVPLVLHDTAQREKTMAVARTEAELFAAAGATTFVSTAVVDDAWAPPFPLSASQWDHLVGMLAELDELCAGHGLEHALHPHVGTLVETERRRARGARRVPPCAGVSTPATCSSAATTRRCSPLTLPDASLTSMSRTSASIWPIAPAAASCR